MRGTLPTGPVLALVLAGAPLGQPPAHAADPEHGERLAHRWCASCHAVAAGQRQATAEATPFSEMAARSDWDAPRVAFYLLLPHPRMPDMSLSRSEAEDLAVYIGRQRR